MNSLFAREYGYQYTRYEFASMKRLYKDKIRRSEELRGYITRIDDCYILRPTYTTLYPYIVCKSDREISNNVRLYGRWNYNIDKEYLIFDIEDVEEIKLDHTILKDVIKYNQYLDMLFDNAMIDEKVKEIIGHILISRGEKPFRLLIRSGNADMLIKRLKRFIPIEFISMNKFFIKELTSYFIMKPILSFDTNSSINILFDTDINLTLDSIYVYGKTDEFTLYDVLKFIVSMHMIHIDCQTYYKDIINYLMSNRLNRNSINTILSLSIANAKINRQRMLEIDNVRYIMNLFKANLRLIAL